MDREAGANPARTRHCHRGSPPHACVASHWSAIGPGRRGGVGPGARRPPSDHKPEALVEGVAPCISNVRSAGLAAGLLTLVLAAPAVAAPSNVTVRIEGAAEHARRGGRVLDHDHARQQGRTGRLPGHERGRRARARHQRRLGRHVLRRQRHLRRRADLRRDLHRSTRAATTGRSGSTAGPPPRASAGDELQEGDDVLFFVDQCFDAQPPDYACKNPPVRPLELTAPGDCAAWLAGASARRDPRRQRRLEPGRRGADHRRRRRRRRPAPTARRPSNFPQSGQLRAEGREGRQRALRDERSSPSPRPVQPAPESPLPVARRTLRRRSRGSAGSAAVSASSAARRRGRCAGRCRRTRRACAPSSSA